MLSVACFVVLAHVAGALLLSWGYFRRYTVARPPIGVFNLGDVAIMLLCIVLVPVFYLLLPRWLVAALLAAAALSVLSLTWEPVLRARWAIWLVTILLVAADIALALGFGAMSTPSLLANNAVLVVMAVGLTNLWTQSGMQARAVVLLGATLLIYDFVATSRLGHMDDLFSS